MVTDEPAPEPVIHQPGIAILTGQPKAAGAAQRQRRIAATIEEQQRLLFFLERDLHRLGQPRRDEASARRALRAKIDRLDIGRCWPPKRSGNAGAGSGRAAH